MEKFYSYNNLSEKKHNQTQGAQIFIDVNLGLKAGNRAQKIVTCTKFNTNFNQFV